MFKKDADDSPAVTVLRTAQTRGVVFTPAGDRLLYSAPPGAITPELLESMRTHKAEILARILADVLTLPFTLEALAIAEIGVDDRYQRPLSEAKISMFGLTYDIGVAGAIDVSRRPDGSYWVMDGQHRKEKAHRVGETHMLCHVRDMPTWQHEAAFFVAKNRMTTRPQPVHSYRARLGAADPIIVGIEALLAKHGFHVNYTNTHADAFGVQAVSELETMYRRLGPRQIGGSRTLDPGRLDRVLGLARRTWRDKAGMVDGIVLRALDGICVRYGDTLDDGTFAARVGHTDPKRLQKEAVERAKVIGMSATTSLAVRLVEVYNFKLQKNRLSNYFKDMDETKNGAE